MYIFIKIVLQKALTDLLHLLTQENKCLVIGMSRNESIQSSILDCFDIIVQMPQLTSHQKYGV